MENISLDKNMLEQLRFFDFGATENVGTIDPEIQKIDLSMESQRQQAKGQIQLDLKTLQQSSRKHRK